MLNTKADNLDVYERAKADDEQWEREHDTREKLERDIHEWCDVIPDFECMAREWIDRQAAITERHWMEINGANTLASIEINKQREELQRKVDELQAQLAQCKESYADAKDSRDRLQAQLDEYDQTHMVLPVDADGVPIKIGDKIQQLNHAGVWTDAMPVIAVDDHGCFALAHGIACDARTYVWGNNCRHVKQCTVEDVLRDAGVSIAAISDVAAEIRELMGVCDE